MALFQSPSHIITFERQESLLQDQTIFPLDYDDHPDSFFKSTRPIIILAQFFGIMIVHGATGSMHILFFITTIFTNVKILLKTYQQERILQAYISNVKAGK